MNQLCLFSIVLHLQIVNGHERFLELRDITDKSIPFFVSNFCSLTMESMINVTDKYELVQKACCTEELIQVLLNDIIPLLSDIKWDQVINTCSHLIGCEQTFFAYYNIQARLHVSK